MTQEQQILKHLKQGLTIDPMIALRRYGCLRLAARIHDLRAKGHQIKTEMENDGDKKWAVYYL